MKGAIFVVEGQTEQIFVQQFIEQLIAVKECHVSLEKLSDGVSIKFGSRGFPLDKSSHHIRIINVGNDDKVNTYIRDSLGTFKRKGFEIIFGLRDRYTGDKKKKPLNPDKIDAVFEQLAGEWGLTLGIIIAVEEIEAWFLSVPSFFLKYNESLTIGKVNEILGIDLSATAVETLPHPSLLIDKVLSTVKQRYEKRKDDSYKIANALDYASLYLEKKTSIPAINRFVQAMDSALA